MYWPSPDLSYYGNLLPTIYIVNSLLHLIAVLIYLSWGLFFLIKPVQLNLYLNHWVHISITREMSFTIWCSNLTRKSILNTNLSLNGGWKVKARKRHVHNKEPMNIPLCISKKWLLQVKPQKFAMWQRKMASPPTAASQAWTEETQVKEEEERKPLTRIVRFSFFSTFKNFSKKWIKLIFFSNSFLHSM